MARAADANGERPAGLSDKALWDYCRAIDAEPDEAEQLLDLAGFAYSRLDEDEHERVAALLMADIGAAGDVAAARALAAARHGEAPDAAVARAAALVAAPRGEVIPFRRPWQPHPGVSMVARWGSIAAAIAVASWLGFALGTDASVALSKISPSSDDSFIGDLMDPGGGVLRSISDGLES